MTQPSQNQQAKTEPEVLDPIAVAASIRKAAQQPNAVATAHEIHGELTGGSSR